MRENPSSLDGKDSTSRWCLHPWYKHSLWRKHVNKHINEPHFRAADDTSAADYFMSLLYWSACNFRLLVEEVNVHRHAGLHTGVCSDQAVSFGLFLKVWVYFHESFEHWSMGPDFFFYHKNVQMKWEPRGMDVVMEPDEHSDLWRPATQCPMFSSPVRKLVSVLNIFQMPVLKGA